MILSTVCYRNTVSFWKFSISSFPRLMGAAYYTNKLVSRTSRLNLAVWPSLSRMLNQDGGKGE